MAGPESRGTLAVVATPIGNLEDITLRALRVLREADLIAAEDTRRTARLLQHYSISTPTTSFHEHNERRKLPALLARLAAGGRIALVTDAGTPGVSDPGAALVRAAREAGTRVEVVPGASAVLTALAGSGLRIDSFVFAGFAPRRANDRARWLEALARENRPVVFFEAPHRIRQTLEQAGPILGERPIIVARELTKLHEELVERPIAALLDHLWAPRGELTVVVPPQDASAPAEREVPSDTELAQQYGQLTRNRSVSRREALRSLARKYGISAREVFSALERSHEDRSGDQTMARRRR